MIEKCSKCYNSGMYQCDTLPEGRPVITYCVCQFGIILMAHDVLLSVSRCEESHMTHNQAGMICDAWLENKGIQTKVKSGLDYEIKGNQDVISIDF